MKFTEEKLELAYMELLGQKGLKSKTPVNWTTLNDMDLYLCIMHQIRQDAKEKGQSIAEWELEVFERN